MIHSDYNFCLIKAHLCVALMILSYAGNLTAQSVDTITYSGGRFKYLYDYDPNTSNSETIIQSAFKSYTADSLLWAYKRWETKCISYAIYDYTILEENPYNMIETQIRDTCSKVDIYITQDSIGRIVKITYGSNEHGLTIDPLLDFIENKN